MRNMKTVSSDLYDLEGGADTIKTEGNDIDLDQNIDNFETIGGIQDDEYDEDFEEIETMQ